MQIILIKRILTDSILLKLKNLSPFALSVLQLNPLVLQ
jgi:hypothetical protein